MRVQLRRTGLRRGGWIGDGVQDLVVDLDQRRRRPRRRAAVRRDQREHVADVAGGLTRRVQLRPVRDQFPLNALAGHILGGEHRDDPRVGPGALGADPQDHRARMVGEPDRAERHPRHGEVVDVGLVSQRQLGPLIAGGARADPARMIGGRQRHAAPGPRREADGVQDLGVTGAPAQVPGQGGGDPVPARLGFPAQQGLGLHHDSGEQ